MNAIILAIGLAMGTVSDAEARDYLVAQAPQVVQTQIAQMSNEQITQRYATPAGWSDEDWAEAVRTINPNIPAGRR